MSPDVSAIQKYALRARENLLKLNGDERAFAKYLTQLDSGVGDVLTLNGANQKVKMMADFLEKYPKLKSAIEPVLNKLLAIRQGTFFTSLMGKLPKGIQTSLGNLAKNETLSKVGHFFKQPMKGPAFMAFALDLGISAISSVKEGIQAFRNSDNAVSGIFNGVFAFGKSIAKNAISIGAGMGAAAAVPLLLGLTGPVGWVAGALAYTGASMLTGKVLSNVPLPALALPALVAPVILKASAAGQRQQNEEFPTMPSLASYQSSNFRLPPNPALYQGNDGGEIADRVMQQFDAMMREKPPTLH